MCTEENITRRCDLMLFDYRTTYRTDFRNGAILPPQEPVLQPRPKPKRKQKEVHLTDTHTVTKYKDPHFPFDLMAVPKEIIRTNCRDKQQPFEKPIDKDMDEVRRKRPRVVMVPAASLDDIEDIKKRQLILDETYTTTWNKASRLVTTKYDNARFNAPLRTTSKTNPLALPERIEHAYVHPGFRWQSLAWERQQMRGECNPTAEFWKRRPLDKKLKASQK